MCGSWTCFQKPGAIRNSPMIGGIVCFLRENLPWNVLGCRISGHKIPYRPAENPNLQMFGYSYSQQPFFIQFRPPYHLGQIALYSYWLLPNRFSGKPFEWYSKLVSNFWTAEGFIRFHQFEWCCLYSSNHPKLWIFLAMGHPIPSSYLDHP